MGPDPLDTAERKPSAESSASAAAPTGLQAYGVVRGRPVEQRVFAASGPNDSPHLHVLLDGGAQRYDAAVNVFSKDQSEVLYLIAPGVTPAQGAALLALPAGATPIRPGNANGIGLDYLRQRLVSRTALTLLPIDPHNPTNALHNALGALIGSAISEQADVFAFGSLFSDPGGAATGANPFGLRPDAGVHDIHMNQGNPANNHGRDNGTYQDGGILVHAATPKSVWTAVYIAFQSQSFVLQS